MVKTLTQFDGIEKFDFLRKKAIELGAADAKIIPSNYIVIEDRVVLKCKVGCTNYGKTLACPPYTPTAEEFRKIVGEYRYALFMKFEPAIYVDPEIKNYLSKKVDDPDIPEGAREKVKLFWTAWKEGKHNILSAVVSVEKAAMNEGYPLSIGFVSGACQLCEKCNVETRVCARPTMARYSEDAVGVNVKKTAKNSGIQFKFPIETTPVSFALVLID